MTRIIAYGKIDDQLLIRVDSKNKLDPIVNRGL